MNKIAVFSKKPEQGESKTRLVPPLTLNEAKELSEAFLKDTISLINTISCINQKLFYCCPSHALEYFKSITFGANIALKRNSLATSSWMIKTQEGKDLGERLLNAVSGELQDRISKSGSNSNKAEKIIIIGSDSPTIPEEYISEAFLILETEDIVLGPADDGGFYLIGAKKIWPGIFKSVRWSCRDTLEDVVFNLKKLSIKYKLLPQWYDVDEIADIRKLSEDIYSKPNFYCSNTRAMLNKLDKKLKFL